MARTLRRFQPKAVSTAPILHIRQQRFAGRKRSGARSLHQDRNVHTGQKVDDTVLAVLYRADQLVNGLTSLPSPVNMAHCITPDPTHASINNL